MEEVAAAIHRHPEVVRRQARDGRLPAEKIGRVWFFKPERLIEAGYAQFSSVGQEPGVAAGGTEGGTHARPLLIALTEAGLQALQNPERQAIFEAVGNRLARAGLSTYIWECTPDGRGIRTVFRFPLSSAGEVAALSGNESVGAFYPFEKAPSLQQVVVRLRPHYVGDPEELVTRIALAAKPGNAGNARRIGELLKMRAAISAPLVVAERAIGAITVIGHDLQEVDVPAVMAFANQTAAALETARLLAESRQTEEAAVLTLAAAIELREALHSRATEHAAVASRFAEHLQLDQAQRRRVRYTSLLQDLGKLTLPDSIVKKRGGRLEPEERAVFMAHPVVGADLLSRLAPLAPLAPLVRAHHEWFDGKGYPDGLAGEAIPIETRVVAVVNAFFNLVFDLPNRSEKTVAEGLDELAELSGTTLDPQLAQTFIRMCREAAAARQGWYETLVSHVLESGTAARPAGSDDVLGLADSRELRILYRIAQETMAVLDVGTLLNRIVAIIRDVMGYYLVTILLPLEKLNQLRVGAQSGYDRDIVGMTIEVDRGITGWAFTHGQPLIVSDVRKDERYFGLDPRVRSEIAFPLISRGRVVGVLNAESEQLDAFSEADVALMSAVGSQLASHIEVAQLHDALKREANHDPLTRLFNRRLFLERAQQQIERAEASQEPFSILFLDVDDLKRINDTYGHLAGDALLREVANAIMDAVRGEDVVARYGGDEFIVLLPSTAATAAATVAQRVVDGIERHRFMAGRELLTVPGVSLGIATFPQDGKTAEQLLAVADATLYQEKRKAS